MRLTTKGRYAVTALLDLAIHQKEGPITISTLALRHGISPTYLERLAGIMRSKGLLKSVRGPRGGYILARPPEAITLADIIDAVDERIDATRCQGKANCHEGGVCLTHHLWDELNHKIAHFFQGITLRALAEKPQVMAVARRKQTPIHFIKVEHA
ncbi:MAG: Rrf2 family transcriptional regulator [Proteobacteria bacterium]|nr:Rrf2 family transcriptional regulator [Pseudomonadota bacterium]